MGGIRFNGWGVLLAAAGADSDDRRVQRPGLMVGPGILQLQIY